jgi:hypothetical protein
MAAAGTAVVVEASGMGERIPGGVRVDGVLVGGLSPEEAARKLETHASAVVLRSIVLAGPKLTVTTTGKRLRARPRRVGGARRDECRKDRIFPPLAWPRRKPGSDAPV